MIVIVSWIFYRYLREWARAGLVQVFIIALYADMYGFPLMIYLSVGLFGERVVHWSTVFLVTLFPAIVIAYTLLAYRRGAADACAVRRAISQLPEARADVLPSAGGNN